MNNSQLTKNCSPLLRAFYIAYYGWLKDGAQFNATFSCKVGLCANGYDFFKSIGVNSEPLLEELHAAFVADGLNEKLPFNDDPYEYQEEARRGRCHINPARAAWVESWATAELQEHRKATAEPVAYAVSNNFWAGSHKKAHFEGRYCDLFHKGECNPDDYDHVYPLYAAPQPLNDAERAELQEHRKAAAEPVAWRSLYHENHGLLTGSRNVLKHWEQQGWKCEPLYTTPPAPKTPDGWKLVPIEPTEDMVIAGFESEPDEHFSNPDEWESYQSMTGCQQAAHKTKLCWSAMLAVAPQYSK